MKAGKKVRSVRRTVQTALAIRRAAARDVVALGRQIARAPLAEGQMDNVLKLHTLWHELGQVEELLQVLTGTPAHQAGVWPSGRPSADGTASEP